MFTTEHIVHSFQVIYIFSKDKTFLAELNTLQTSPKKLLAELQLKETNVLQLLPSIWVKMSGTPIYTTYWGK